MRNSPFTITTRTIAESIVTNPSPGADTADPFGVDVEVVKGRLDLIAQLTGVKIDHVLGHQSVELIDAYDDKVKRGVYALN